MVFGAKIVFLLFLENHTTNYKTHRTTYSSVQETVKPTGTTSQQLNSISDQVSNTNYETTTLFPETFKQGK